MEIIEIKTKADLKALYDCSAMTWEGLREEDFGEALNECCRQGQDGVGYLTKGKTMNEICHLTGDNAYPDELNIFSIKDYKGLAISYGARWMDDIIDNNAYRQHYHPFRKKY